MGQGQGHPGEGGQELPGLNLWFFVRFFVFFFFWWWFRNEKTFLLPQKCFLICFFYTSPEGRERYICLHLFYICQCRKKKKEKAQFYFVLFFSVHVLLKVVVFVIFDLVFIGFVVHPGYSSSAFLCCNRTSSSSSRSQRATTSSSSSSRSSSSGAQGALPRPLHHHLPLPQPLPGLRQHRAVPTRVPGGQRPQRRQQRRRGLPRRRGQS